MIEFVGLTPDLENNKIGMPLKPCFFIEPIPNYVLENFVLHSEGPTEQFGMDLKGPRSAG